MVLVLSGVVYFFKEFIQTPGSEKLMWQFWSLYMKPRGYESFFVNIVPLQKPTVFA